MVQLILILVAILVVLAILSAVGGAEPIYRITTGAPAWFVALKRAPHVNGRAFAPGVGQVWAGKADFALIGADETYWTDFLILSGGDGSQLPIDLTNIEDAYVARLRQQQPPRIALGVLKALIAGDVLTKPKGEPARDVQDKGYRNDVMPTRAAIDQLLSRPADYAPTMVNFLCYRERAQYPDGRASSGRAAYARYGMIALRTVYRTGGRLMFYGAVADVLRHAKAGPTMGAWSDVAAMRYANPPAILTMEHVPEYRAALKHRDAGLERTVVIASSEGVV